MACNLASLRFSSAARRSISMRRRLAAAISTRSRATLAVSSAVISSLSIPIVYAGERPTQGDAPDLADRREAIITEQWHELWLAAPDLAPWRDVPLAAEPHAQRGSA